MAKSIWKGELSFGLVSIPVSLVSVEENNELRFHLLDAKTKSRIRYKRVNEETGKEVPWNEIVKAYEYDNNSYIIVNEDAFVKEEPELFKVINIDEFVDLQEIDNIYYSKPYYLQPESKNKKAYVLLRESLKNTHKVGVGKIIIRTKESLSLIIPHNHALLLYLIHFSDEIREENEINVPKDEIKSYKISSQEIKMAESLIKEMTSKWKPEKYHNEYRKTMQKWLEQQMAKLTKSQKKAPSAKAYSGESVVDFISLLKESRNKKRAKKLAPAAPKKTAT